MRTQLSPTNAMAPRLGVLCMLAMGLASMLPATDAHAQDPATEQPTATHAEPVTVNVVFMPIADQRDEAELQAEFQRQFPAFAEEHGLVDASTVEPELTFRLQLRKLDNGTDNYMIYSTAIYHDKVDTAIERTCLRCSPASVVASALTNLADAAAAVVENRSAYEATKAPAVEVEPEQPIAPPSPPPRVRVIGAVSYVGFASTVVGLGLGIAGAVVLDRGVVLETDPFSVTSRWTDYRRTGMSMLAPGLGLMAAGTMLVAVDLGVLLPRRRARAQARLDSVSVVITGSPGLTISGRF